MIDEMTFGAASIMAWHCASNRQCCIAGFGWNGRAPRRQILALLFFRLVIALGDRIRNPKIQLKLSLALSPKIGGPGFDFLRLHQQRSTCSQAACIRDGNRQRGRGRSRHGASRTGKRIPRAWLKASARARGDRVFITAYMGHSSEEVFARIPISYHNSIVMR